MHWRELPAQAAELARSATAYAGDLVTPTLRLGVTGLARAGKTVFITALVNTLVSRGRLTFFDPAAQGRLIGAFLTPQPDDGVPRFAYETHLAALTGDPAAWPDSTRRVSQLRLTIDYRPSGFMRRQLGRGRIHVDIVDYPGEWLLDLPLLALSYEDWSAEVLRLSRTPEREALAADWHGFLTGLDADRPQDEGVAGQGARLFAAYLDRCRAQQHALSTLPPGRLLMPGELADTPALTFMPLDAAPGVVRRGSLRAMMARRYEAYKTHVVRPFFTDHFARLDRQIVLVDLLSALNAGPSAVADLERALSGILNCFRPGARSWLGPLAGRRIDRILFAATKADHLHHASHDRLGAILDHLVRRAADQATLAGAEVRSLAIAALRATSEAEMRRNGDSLPCIVGTPLAGERLDGRLFDGSEDVAIFPGDLPARPEDALAGDGGHPAWDGEALRFVRFSPPNAEWRGRGSSALPHIRLDRALDFLIGDWLP